MSSLAGNLHKRSINNLLSGRWNAPWDRLGIDPQSGLFETVMSRLGEAHRRYHTSQKLHESLLAFDAIAHHCYEPALVELAIWFMDTHFHAERSGHLTHAANGAFEHLVSAGGTPEAGLRLRHLILSSSESLKVRTADVAVLRDASKAVFAAESSRFDEHELQLRDEFRFMQGRHFAEMRGRHLSSLRLTGVYRTLEMRREFEGAALLNIQRRLRILSD